MPSKIFKFQGPVRWAKVFEHNRDKEGFNGAAEAYGGQYSIEMKLDADQWDTLKKSGSAKQGKRGDNDWVKFTRKHEGPFKEASGAPRVVKKDNTLWSFDDDGYIGNDSVAEATVVVYTTKAGINGTRLEKIKVIENNEYVEKDEDEEYSYEEPEEASGEKADIPF